MYEVLLAWRFYFLDTEQKETRAKQAKRCKQWCIDSSVRRYPHVQIEQNFQLQKIQIHDWRHRSDIPHKTYGPHLPHMAYPMALHTPMFKTSKSGIDVYQNKTSPPSLLNPIRGIGCAPGPQRRQSLMKCTQRHKAPQNPESIIPEPLLSLAKPSTSLGKNPPPPSSSVVSSHEHTSCMVTWERKLCRHQTKTCSSPSCVARPCRLDHGPLCASPFARAGGGPPSP